MLKTFISILLSVFLFLTKINSVVYAEIGTGDEPAKLQDLEIVFGNIAGFLIPAAGILFFLMVIIGGFRYLTSGGDVTAVTAAHRTLTYGLGGLIVTAIAYLILVVVSELTGAEILEFKVYQPN